MTNATLYQALNELLNDRFSNKMSVLEQHSVDESWHKGRAPQGVCYPINNGVSTVLTPPYTFSNDSSIVFIPRDNIPTGG